MVELTIRIVLASGLMALSGALGAPSFDLTWRVMAVFAAYSFFIYQFDRKGMRNAGVAGAAAVADAAVIAVLLGSAGQLSSFGFVALIPAAWAANRYQANPLAMAPLIAGAIMLSANVVAKEGMTWPILVQAGLSLGMGLLFASPRPAQVTLPLTESDEDLLPMLPAAISPIPADLLDLRERFRQLKDHTQELERRTRRDRILAQLFDIQPGPTDSFHTQLADKVAEITGAEGVSIYTSAHLADSMVVRASSGTLPEALRTAMIDISHSLNDAQLRHKADKALRALRQEDEKQLAASILLKDRGKLIGMMVVSHRNLGRLDESLGKAEDAAPYVASLLSRAERETSQMRRLRETEILYAISSLCVGTDSLESAAQRSLRELWEMLTLDHLSLVLLDDSTPRVLASQGAAVSPLDLLRLPGGPGLAGWLKLDAPEFSSLNTGEDARLDRTAALKARVGSLALIPIRLGNQLRGVLVATTHRPGGVDMPDIECLRIVSLELAQAFARLESNPLEAEGLVTPLEFQKRVAKGAWGHLVYLEPLRQEHLQQQFGRPAYEHAIRAVARRLRPSLPAGALLCRRNEGDFVAYLPEASEELARSWMSQACALAAMTPISTPDGRTSIPLGLKGKFAPFGQQKYEFFEQIDPQTPRSRMIA